MRLKHTLHTLKRQVFGLRQQIILDFRSYTSSANNLCWLILCLGLRLDCCRRLNGDDGGCRD